MKASVLKIHWHDKQPVFSLDFDPSEPSRLATAGGDNNIRIWRLTETTAGLTPVYCATLARHIKPVNCVRFSHSGRLVASAGDGGTVILWKQNTNGSSIQPSTPFGLQDSADEAGEEEEDELVDNRECWNPVGSFRSSEGEDIYDLCWSPDDRHLLLGLTDNTAQVWELASQRCARVLRDHHHFVQGVAWDPLGKYLVTQSCDRTVKIWQSTLNSKGGLSIVPVNKLVKAQTQPSDRDTPDRVAPMFHDEMLVSFFRRPAFSPDGALLILPAGLDVSKDETDYANCFYTMARNQILA